MANDVGDKLRRTVADRAYHVCEYCLIHEDDTFWGCHVDHIISRKHNGPTELQNLAWSCATCNNAKGSDIASLGGQTRELTRLFDPRVDLWAGVFNLVNVRIDPLTIVGEVTVNLLRINEEQRMRERHTLASAGRYPTVEALARMKE
jgi:hypothetical protein